ncbi:MAG: hypothetical protein C0508_10685 [Cyanobacteria bacterium PR.023]|nr:hypothetical protein [Cyanobacteria bacterium PR.023]
MSDKATATTAEKANPRELTTRIEQHDLSANKELLDLKAKMSPKEYAQLLKTIEATNLQDREINQKLPKLLIIGDNKKAEFVGVDYAPMPFVKAKDGNVTAVEKGNDKESKSSQPSNDDGNYPNTAVGREKLWNAFFGSARK